MSMKHTVGAALLGFSLLFGGSASAATCAADASYLLSVTGDDSGSNSGCFLGTTNNDGLNVNAPPNGTLQVNLDGAFGGGWSFSGKLFDGAEEKIDIDAAVAAGSNQASGTWSVISTFFSTYKELMIVLKGGNGQGIVPGEYVGYLITSDDGTTGRYATPFSKNGATNISHISFYVRGDGDNGGGGGIGQIPLPAGFPLMLAGFGVMALVARRKARKA